MDEEYLWLVNKELYLVHNGILLVGICEYVCLCYALFFLVFSPHGANAFFFYFFLKLCHCLVARI